MTLVFDTEIADRAGDGALGLAEAGCSKMAHCAGEGTGTLWADTWDTFSSLPLLPPDNGAEEADGWDTFRSVPVLPREGHSEDEPSEEEDPESVKESRGTKSRSSASARPVSLLPWSKPL